MTGPLVRGILARSDRSAAIPLDGTISQAPDDVKKRNVAAILTPVAMADGRTGSAFIMSGAVAILLGVVSLVALFAPSLKTATHERAREIAEQIKLSPLDCLTIDVLYGKLTPAQAEAALAAMPHPAPAQPLDPPPPGSFEPPISSPRQLHPTVGRRPSPGSMNPPPMQAGT